MGPNVFLGAVNSRNLATDTGPWEEKGPASDYALKRWPGSRLGPSGATGSAPTGQPWVREMLSSIGWWSPKPTQHAGWRFMAQQDGSMLEVIQARRMQQNIVTVRKAIRPLAKKSIMLIR